MAVDASLMWVPWSVFSLSASRVSSDEFVTHVESLRLGKRPLSHTLTNDGSAGNICTGSCCLLLLRCCTVNNFI